MQAITIRFAAILGLVLCFGLAYADERASSREKLNNIISKKLTYYKQRYPDIHFVHMGGGGDWQSDLVALLNTIGYDPVPMDYQHPPELRNDVLEVTMEHLRQMLQYDIVSATLFKTGERSRVKRPYVCVITLNPDTYVASDRRATQYMLDIKADVIDKVYSGRYLDHLEHLKFTLDHDAYHCLDSYLHGGAPMTQNILRDQYYLFRRENAADAYAMSMHIRREGLITSYARNLLLYRALWLFTDSPNRDTFETIRQVLRMDPVRITDMADKQIVHLAKEVRDQAVRPYEDFVKHRATALKAASILGIGPTVYGNEWCDWKKIETDPSEVGFLINRYRYYYDQLFTDTVIPLEAPQMSDSLQR